VICLFHEHVSRLHVILFNNYWPVIGFRSKSIKKTNQFFTTLYVIWCSASMDTNPYAFVIFCCIRFKRTMCKHNIRFYVENWKKEWNWNPFDKLFKFGRNKNVFLREWRNLWTIYAVIVWKKKNSLLVFRSKHVPRMTIPNYVTKFSVHRIGNCKTFIESYNIHTRETHRTIFKKYKFNSKFKTPSLIERHSVGNSHGKDQTIFARRIIGSNDIFSRTRHTTLSHI